MHQTNNKNKMSWFFGDSRRSGHQGWRENTISSFSLPPPPLIAVFAIVMLFLSLSWYTDYKAKIEETEFSLRFLFLFVPVVLIFVARNMFVNGRFVVRLPRPEQEAIHRAGSSPWGVAALVVLLLVLVSYQSSFHSKWFRPLWWRSHYWGVEYFVLVFAINLMSVLSITTLFWNFLICMCIWVLMCKMFGSACNGRKVEGLLSMVIKWNKKI